MSASLLTGFTLPHPSGRVRDMGETSTTLFTEAARVLANATHQYGVLVQQDMMQQDMMQTNIVVPGFRTPPRIVGRDRTIRRSPDGTGGVVAVRLRGRPFTAVIADMIEGVVVLNRLTPPESDRLRGALWKVMLQFTMVHESSISRVA